jgi:hypothetical protein
MRYSCEVYTEPNTYIRVIELLAALPRDRGYWYRVEHGPACPCRERAPLGDCTCTMIYLQVEDADVGPFGGIPTRNN